MAGERKRRRVGPDASSVTRPTIKPEDVLAQRSTDPNDDLPDAEWAEVKPQIAARLREVANTLCRSTPMRVSKKQGAFLQAAVDAETDEPLSVKFLAVTARAGERTYRNDSDAKRVATKLSANNGPFYRTTAGLILETTRRKAPQGVSWHDLTELQRQLLTGLSREVVARALTSNSTSSLRRLHMCGGLGGPTIAKLAGVPYCANVALLLRDLVLLAILRRNSPRRLRASKWPSDAPFRPHPLLRDEGEGAGMRRSELRRQLLLRQIARSSFQATRRQPPEPAL